MIPSDSRVDSDSQRPDFNDWTKDFPDGPVHHWIEARAARFPSRPALVQGAHLVTYEELNLRANRLAFQLIEQGARPDSLIGLCLDRTPDLFVSILAIWKSGAAYVALDPAYPRQRLRDIVQDAGLRLVLTTSNRTTLFKGLGGEILCTDAPPVSDQHGLAENPGCRAGKPNLAYVIYTSGSTGSPKGVLIEHGGLMNVASEQLRIFQTQPESRILQFASFSFDVSVFDLVWAWCAGAALHLPPPGTAPVGRMLASLLKTESITHAAFPVSVLSTLPQESIPELKVLVVGGESCPPSLIEAWAPGRRFFNAYGPTEGTIWATLAESIPGVARPNIGYPLRGTEVLLLDDDLNEVAPGTVGEICLAGVGLARGYLNRPELTCERFTFLRPPMDWKRIYRTGDLGRMLPEGTFEFMGRSDQQVKVRGFRIELEELEFALRQDPEVRQAAAVVRGTNPADRSIAAWVSAAPSEESRIDLARSHILGWNQVADQAYEKPAAVQDPTFNVAGWRDSCTFAPIPAPEMREWLDSLASLVLSGAPARVLEIGVGLGLVLFRIAPHCRKYVATDFSAPALDYVRRHLHRVNLDPNAVVLLERAADDLGDLPEAGFDCILINSVVQCFPDERYLTSVIQKASRLVADGGRVIVGDVRSLPLLNLLQARIKLAHLSDSSTVRTLRDSVQSSPDREPELVVDPGYFSRLPRLIPAITRIEILPKLCKARNELTCYRYEAVLHFGSDLKSGRVNVWMDWEQDSVTRDSLRKTLLSSREEYVAVRRIPNARLAGDLKLLHLLDQLPGEETIGSLRTKMVQDADVGLDPAEISELAESAGFSSEVQWADHGPDGRFDVLFLRRGCKRMRWPDLLPMDDAGLRPLTTDPLWNPLKNRLRSRLVAHLGASLPAYMMPSAIHVSAQLPLLPSGKVDRSRLTDPVENERDPCTGGSLEPLSPVESGVCRIFAQILGMDRVALNESFFALGGNSLRVPELLLKLNESFGVDLEPSTLMEAATPGEIARLLNQRGAGTHSVHEGSVAERFMIVPDPPRRNEPFPLTDIQKSYLVGRGSSYELGNVATHAFLEIDATGIDLKRLSDALNQVIRRHDMLRTIVLPDGRQQSLAEVSEYIIRVHDFTNSETDEAGNTLAQLREKLAHAAVDPSIWPLFDIRAIALPGGKLLLFVALDILMTDASSTLLIFREWRKFYDEPTWNPTPLQLSFRDCVLAQVQRESLPTYEEARNYWIQRIDSLPGPPLLPLTRSPGSVDRPTFKRRSLRLDRPVWQAIKSKAATESLTPSMVLAATFASVLAAWSKDPHFTLNVTLFNRPAWHPEINAIMGDFTSLTLLEVQPAGRAGFRQFASALQKQLWEDLKHSEYGATRFMNELVRRGGDPGRAVMPVVFTSALPLNDAEEGQPLFGQFGPVVGGLTESSQVWLDHIVFEDSGALSVHWDAVEALFPEGLLDAMFEAYCAYLKQLGSYDSTWMARIPHFLPPCQSAVRPRIEPQSVPEGGQLLHLLFRSHALIDPNRIAVVSKERTLTRAELWEESLNLGMHLRSLGAQPNKLIAVVLPKGWQQVTAVFSILHSGAAYLPIDPGLPPARILELLSHSEAELVLTDRETGSAFRWPDGLRTIVVERQFLQSLPPGRADPVQTPSDLAYVIYTSGSTGKPKGVMIAHQSAVQTILDVNRRFGIGPDSRTLAVSSLSFDLSVWDIFGTLAAGGVVVIPDHQSQPDPSHWIDLMRTHQVTVWNSVPSLMRLLIEQLSTNRSLIPQALRLVMLSGDWIPISMPAQLKGFWPELKTVSLGGATEASIWSNFFEIGELEPDWPSIPYGWPLSGQCMKVLNKQGLECPDWAVGEIHIGGAGLSEGYWKDPARTAERFVFHARNGERLYRTGDLGRFRPGGILEFLGREDTQVKLGGHRIELGEIEARLREHGEVGDAAVALFTAPGGAKRLVSWVIPMDLRPTDPLQQPMGADLNSYPERLEFKLKRMADLEQPRNPAAYPLPTFPPVDLAPYVARRTHRAFSESPTSLESLSGLLRSLLRIPVEGFAFPKARYPSAGSLYPVRTFIVIQGNRVNGLQQGCYEYHPLRHELLPGSKTCQLNSRAGGEANRVVLERAAFAILLVGDLESIQPLYGNQARDFCLLEAGAMIQLLMNECPSHQLGLCPIGWYDTTNLGEGISLDGSRILLHMLAGGTVTDEKPVLSPASPGFGAIPEPLDVRLRSHLESQLPSYMVPTDIILRSTFPLSANGKVDRKALLLELERKSEAPDCATPSGASSDTETRLARLFEEITGRKNVPVEQNFFAAGADSLHLVRLQNRIQQEFSRPLSMVDLFRNPGIRQLARFMDSQDVTVAQGKDEARDRAARQRAAFQTLRHGRSDGSRRS